VLALGIDTSTPMVSVTLVEAEPLPRNATAVMTRPPRAVARRDELVNNTHGEVLAAFIDEVFRDAGASTTDLAAVGVGLGPGPFTSLRVGVVTAVALSDALGVPAYGVCSLDVVATVHATDQDRFVVVSDARRRQLYWAVYNEVGGREEGPEIGFPQDVAAHVRDRVTEVAGPASTLYADAFAGFTITEPRWPDTWWIAQHAWSRAQSGIAPEPLIPMYLRRPDAREPGPPKRVTPT
jgi:tRNA threonylcarbamoyl adenosine modification protein YeaZ